MSTIVDLPPPVAGSPSPNDLKIRGAGRSLQPLFAIFFGLSGAGVAGVAATAIQMVADGGQVLKVGPALFTLAADRSHLLLHDTPPGQRCLYALLTIVRSLPLLAILWNLQDLFDRFGKGEVFSRAAANAVRAVGIWLILDAAAAQAWQAILTGRLVVESRVQGLWEPALGVVVIVAALMMRAGRESEEDREGIV